MSVNATPGPAQGVATAPVRSGGRARSRPWAGSGHKASQSGESGLFRVRLVYTTAMSAPQPTADRPSGLARRLVLVAALVLLAGLAYYVLGRGELSLEALVRHRAAIDAFVAEHRVLAALAYIGLYIVAVALSVPGAAFLTVAGGFLFGVAVGASAAVIGATIGATLIFLVARTALGEPLLRRAGPRAAKLAQGFRADAFSYLLFLRLVPVFPFFVVNLVPAFAGVGIVPFVTATALGIVPASIVYALAGTGLDSVIAAQKTTFDACLAAGRADCHIAFEPKDILTVQMAAALVGLGLLALLPVVARRLRPLVRT